MSATIPSLEEIRAAHERIRPHIHRTPVLRCASLDVSAMAELYFKAENLQKGGAFKFRGAANAVLQLADSQAAKGVATHSSGNHAQAVALAAKLRGVPAHLVMPKGSPEVKQAAVRGYGGEITFCGATLVSREETLKEVVARTGAAFVHSYDDPRVIAGQGTVALELLEDVPELDCVVAPLGGGGLLSGMCIAARGVNSEIRLFGAEPELADDAFRSLESGEVLPPRPPITVADGLRTSLSERTFEVLKRELERVILVSEEDILRAMRLLFERAKTVAEPSGAAALAAVLKEPSIFKGLKVGVVISGGNIDLAKDRVSQYFI